MSKGFNHRLVRRTSDKLRNFLWFSVWEKNDNATREHAHKLVGFLNGFVPSQPVNTCPMIQTRG